MKNSREIQGRFSVLYYFYAIFLLISLCTRTLLLVHSLPSLTLPFWGFLKIYGVGFLFDAGTMMCFFAPLALYLLLVPDRMYRNKVHRWFLYLVSYALLYLLLFTGVAEYLFFLEFGTRFNFIAVDYLVYTHEVLRNIRESYPVFPLLAVLGGVSFLFLLLLRKRFAPSLHRRSTLGERWRTGVASLALPLLFLPYSDISLAHISTNAYANELAANGIYTLFSSFRNNRISYEDFYAVRSNQEVFRNLKGLLREDNAVFTGKDPFGIVREIRNGDREERLNVVVIVQESLSAEFLGAFGDRDNLTPYLDRLARESLFFTNMHASGTRTDRGLEAITLSVPPTPGRSVIKRPHNENMLSWGSVMKEKGYDVKFLYGGYGYFDNMNYFFSHNGFTVVDRTDFERNSIHFENAWGVCDEDLFQKALEESDRSHGTRRPFFTLIMTTSNHRPYTYPDGRIDIPSHSGRKGAVKYADYALGTFLEKARKKPWFDDTVFVVVADHCASSAGKTALPVKRYEIPLFIYSPRHFPPQRIDTLAGQIDIAPTVMGLLHFKYTSSFFGRDILRERPQEARAFISTYQKLGYMKDDRLAVLDVKREVSTYRFDRNTGEMTQIPPDPGLIAEAVSYYQGASYLLEHRGKPVRTADARSAAAPERDVRGREDPVH